MHPLNKRHFGNNYGSLTVRFHNGTTVVNGYVIRQIGTVRYEVSDGATKKICQLAQTQDAADNLTEGLMTFTINGKAIRKMEMNKATTVDGEMLNWRGEEFTLPVYPEPEYVEPVVEEAKPVNSTFTRPGNSGAGSLQLMHGTGNRVTDMVSANNGEIEVAGAIRLSASGAASVVASVDGVYPVQLTSTMKDWTYVYAVGLLNPLPGQAITDLYHFTATIATDNGHSLTWTLRRDAAGAYHFENVANNLDIIDDTQAAGGSIYQGIQRFRFYEAFLGNPAKYDVTVIGLCTVTLTATPKNPNSPAEPVVVEFKANVMTPVAPPPV